MTRLIKALAAYAGRRDGVSTLDFAMVAPVLLLLVLGGMDVGRAILDSQRLQDAAALGAAYAVLHPKDSAGIVSAVRQDLGGQSGTVSVASPDMQCRCGDGASIGCGSAAVCADGTESKITYLTIRADRVFKPITPLSSVFLGQVVLVGQVRIRLH